MDFRFTSAYNRLALYPRGDYQIGVSGLVSLPHPTHGVSRVVAAQKAAAGAMPFEVPRASLEQKKRIVFNGDMFVPPIIGLGTRSVGPDDYLNCTPGAVPFLPGGNGLIVPDYILAQAKKLSEMNDHQMGADELRHADPRFLTTQIQQGVKSRSLRGTESTLVPGFREPTPYVRYKADIRSGLAWAVYQQLKSGSTWDYGDFVRTLGLKVDVDRGSLHDGTMLHDRLIHVPAKVISQRQYDLPGALTNIDLSRNSDDLNPDGVIVDVDLLITDVLVNVDDMPCWLIAAECVRGGSCFMRGRAFVFDQSKTCANSDKGNAIRFCACHTGVGWDGPASARICKRGFSPSDLDTYVRTIAGRDYVPIPLVLIPHGEHDVYETTTATIPVPVGDPGLFKAPYNPVVERVLNPLFNEVTFVSSVNQLAVFNPDLDFTKERLNAYASIHQTSFNGFVTALGAKGTAKMLNQRLRQLMAALRFIRKGQFHRLPSVLKPDRRTPSSGWLEWNFGWQQLYDDIVELWRLYTTRNSLVAGKVLWTKGSHKESFEKGVEYKTLRLDCVPKYDVPVWELGLGVTRPGWALWDLVPYSWVVDLFLPIGRAIEAHEGSLAVTNVAEHTSFRRKQHGVMRNPYDPVESNGRIRSLNVLFEAFPDFALEGMVPKYYNIVDGVVSEDLLISLPLDEKAESFSELDLTVKPKLPSSAWSVATLAAALNNLKR